MCFAMLTGTTVMCPFCLLEFGEKEFPLGLTCMHTHKTIGTVNRNTKSVLYSVENDLQQPYFVFSNEFIRCTTS